MKVSILSESPGGGAGIAAFRLFSSLKKEKDIQVYFLSKSITDSEDQNQSMVKIPQNYSLQQRVWNKLGIKKHRDRFTSDFRELIDKKTEIITLPTSYYKLDQHQFIQDSDIIHLHWVANFIDLPNFIKKSDKPIVWTLHDMNPFQGIFHYKDDMDRNYVNQKVKEFDQQIINKKIKWLQNHQNIHIVCLTQWMMNASMKSEIFGHHPHYLIPNGLDEDKTYKFQSQDIIRQELGFKPLEKIFIFIAQNINLHRKGFDLLQEAIIGTENLNFKLLVIGNKTELDFNNHPNILQFGYICDRELLAKYLYISNACIIPSREDNLPNVMLESMHNGTPILSFNIGGMKDWIKHGITGVLAKKVEAESLRAEIRRIIDDEYDFNSDEITNFAKQNFSSKKQVKNYLDLYNKITQD